MPELIMETVLVSEPFTHAGEQYEDQVRPTARPFTAR